LRRLHRDDREQLQQMVLDHVAQCAGLIVERSAATDAKLFRDRDLDVVDPFAAPQRFEHHVAEAQREQEAVPQATDPHATAAGGARARVAAYGDRQLRERCVRSELMMGGERLRNGATGAHSGWSPSVSITVS